MVRVNARDFNNKSEKNKELEYVQERYQKIEEGSQSDFLMKKSG